MSNTQILGSNVNATMGNSVYLGSGSAYVADGASTKGMAVYNSDGTYAYAGGTPAGVVTVGAKGKERRIQTWRPDWLLRRVRMQSMEASSIP